MMMKVFAKGQVVIPARIRRKLGIVIGERLEVRVDESRGVIELRRAPADVAATLAGSLASYGKGRGFPDRREMDRALRDGMAGGG